MHIDEDQVAERNATRAARASWFGGKKGKGSSQSGKAPGHWGSDNAEGPEEGTARYPPGNKGPRNWGQTNQEEQEGSQYRYPQGRETHGEELARSRSRSARPGSRRTCGRTTAATRATPPEANTATSTRTTRRTTPGAGGRAGSRSERANSLRPPRQPPCGDFKRGTPQDVAASETERENELLQHSHR